MVYYASSEEAELVPVAFGSFQSGHLFLVAVSIETTLNNKCPPLSSGLFYRPSDFDPFGRFSL